jgi:hypothetical protein
LLILGTDGAFGVLKRNEVLEFTNYTALGNKLRFSTLDQEKIPAPMWDTSRGRALARPTKATCLGNPGNSYIQTDIPNDTIWPYVMSKMSKRQIITARSIDSEDRPNSGILCQFYSS